MEFMRIVIWIGFAVGVAVFMYLFVVLPWQLRRGASHINLRRSLPGDELVSDPKTGYTQAITISAPKAEVWRWLVQIGYRRAGWYTYDFLHRLAGIAGSVDDERRSARRIVPELQDLRIGDLIEIAPGMGYTVTGLEPDHTLVLQSILDASKWESVASDDPLPEKYLRSSWVWVLEELNENATRLIVRVRSDHSPGLLSSLSTRLPNALGRLLMQPRTLRTLKQRAEMSVS